MGLALDITTILGSIVDTIGRVHVITKRESTIVLDPHNFTSQPLFLKPKIITITSTIVVWMRQFPN